MSESVVTRRRPLAAEIGAATVRLDRAEQCPNLTPEAALTTPRRFQDRSGDRDPPRSAGDERHGRPRDRQPGRPLDADGAKEITTTARPGDAPEPRGVAPAPLTALPEATRTLAVSAHAPAQDDSLQADDEGLIPFTRWNTVAGDVRHGARLWGPRTTAAASKDCHSAMQGRILTDTALWGSQNVFANKRQLASAS
jgi:hypothetical protein